jgi:hypothetical protein
VAAKVAQRPRPSRAHARHTRKRTLLDFVDDWNVTLLTAAEFRVYTQIRAWCARYRLPRLTPRVARQLGLTPRRRVRFLELGLLVELPDGQLALAEPDFDDRSIDLADGRLLEPADATSSRHWSD